MAACMSILPDWNTKLESRSERYIILKREKPWNGNCFLFSAMKCDTNEKQKLAAARQKKLNDHT